MLRFLKVLSYLLIFISLSAVSLRWILFAAESTDNPLPNQPIIDLHVHVAGYGNNSDCYVSPTLQDSYKFDLYLAGFGISKQQIEQQGDQLLIKKLSAQLAESKLVKAAVVLALDGVIDQSGKLDLTQTQIYIPNDYVAEQIQQYDNLYFGASINPYRHDALQRLDKVKQQGAKLIKWIPNIQHIDPQDPRLITFYKKMRDLKLPLLSHTGQEHAFSNAIDKYGDPLRLTLPLSLGVTVIAAHIATTGQTEQQDNYQRILPLFSRYPNLYADISSLTQINKLGFLAKALKEPRLTGRLVYGSDYPLSNMLLVSPYYFPLKLSFAQMWDIAAINNHWDRDVRLKQALGVPTDLFTNYQQVGLVFE